MKKVVLIIGLLALLFGVAYWLMDDEETANIQSYAECVEAGYPVMESYPEQCSTPDGRTFTNDVEIDTETGLSAEESEHIASKTDLIRVDSPEPLETISSPLMISGQARGQWFFEASFTVTLIDDNGNTLGQHYVTAEDDWMTTDFVDFTGELPFTNPTTDKGVLVLEKANPSGLTENADELRIPVKLDQESTQTRSVSLYYYNPEQDTDETGNIMCSDAGLVAVDRIIPVTMTPAQDVISLLIEGDLTESEESQGITTEFPLDGFELEEASLDDGVLTLSFSDPNNSTSGGSCRAGILWSQIEATALQFDTVSEVQFEPETLFQP